MITCKFPNSLLFGGLMMTLYAIPAHAGLTVHVSDVTDQAVTDAVVYLSTENPLPHVKQSASVEIEQKNKKFIPLVTVVQTGTGISFPNNDTVRHHVYSFSAAKPFELKLYSGAPTAPIMFDKAGTVVVGCNIHDHMIAYIQVVDTPYFAKTNAEGNAILQHVPAGKYTLKVWHYKQLAGSPPSEQSLVVKDDNAAINVKLDYKAN